VVIFYLRTRKSRNILSQSNKIIENKNFLLEEKQKEITDSINYAKRIQSTLLENVKELEGFKHEYFILFMPKDIVSGDFYWMKRKGDDFFISVCDSTGHGVPGAFMSLLNSSMMNEAVVTKNISDPGSIFDSTRSGLMATLSHENSKDGMDAILMNFSDNTIKYAAANNKPVLVRKGELTELKCDKMPVGYSENSSPFQTLDIEAQSGDMIYLYTDGFADQFGGPKGKKFKYANLNKLLVSISEKQLSEQKQVLQKALREWMGDLEQVDDICIVGIRIS
jgi:serine phosphatase RsbU (regulator of sigma subunit)